MFVEEGNNYEQERKLSNVPNNWLSLSPRKKSLLIGLGLFALGGVILAFGILLHPFLLSSLAFTMATVGCGIFNIQTAIYNEYNANSNFVFTETERVVDETSTENDIIPKKERKNWFKRNKSFIVAGVVGGLFAGLGLAMFVLCPFSIPLYLIAGGFIVYGVAYGGGLSLGEYLGKKDDIARDAAFNNLGANLEVLSSEEVDVFISKNFHKVQSVKNYVEDVVSKFSNNTESKQYRIASKLKEVKLQEVKSQISCLQNSDQSKNIKYDDLLCFLDKNWDKQEIISNTQKFFKGFSENSTKITQTSVDEFIKNQTVIYPPTPVFNQQHKNEYDISCGLAI